VPVLVRTPSALLQPPPSLDDAQRAVVEATHEPGPVVVLGAPGTGRTTTLVEAVGHRVASGQVDPDGVLLLAPTRLAAAELRDRVTARLARTLTEPLARTPHSYAFALLRRAAIRAGDPPPRLLSGPEQDRILADLLAGHAAGEGRAPAWPDAVRPALGLRGFRNELRDLLMRALERGLTPHELAELGRDADRPEWVAAAQVLEEYLDVTALATPGAFDPAAIVDTAAALLADDAELLAAEHRRWQLIAVDDHHESTAATARLLDLLARGGPDLLLFGDPDATTQSFRGGDPTLIVGAADRYRRPDGAPANTVVLHTRWRCGAELAATAERVAGGIGASGTARHRRPAPAPGHEAGIVEAHVLRSGTQEAAYIAHLLREEHLFNETPWGQMAVVVRSAGATATLRRGLAAAGVPVSVPTSEVPVRDEPAVRPLRAALRVVLDPGALDPELAIALVTSPLGGADALGLRRLRQALRAEERAGGGGRASDVLLAEALADPARVASLHRHVAEPARRVAQVLAAGRAAAESPEATAETVLWALWSTGGLAEPWRRQALAGGTGGARADRDLDAVVALFDAAGRFVDRLPHAGPQAFLEHLDAQDVPADTLAERAPDADAVALLTAQGAAGREWDVVVVSGLQEGSWPDTRLRGSLLGAPDLVDLLNGRDSGDLAGARRQVLDDERRLLHVAVTRARRRLVATAVRDEDERSSAYLDLVSPPPPDETGDAERPYTVVPRALSLPALVAELRQALLTPGDPRRPQAAEQLARLAAAGVPGAHPDDWYGLPERSDPGRLRAADEQVVVSPSRVEAFTRCGLRWLLESSGGTAGDSAAQGVGTLVHEIAAELPDADAATLVARLDELWPRLGLPASWVGEKDRARARQMLHRYAEYAEQARRHGRELVGVEVDVAVPVGRALIRGRVDRLERDADGRLVVVDLKTGSRPPSDADVAENPQLGVYQVAIEHGGLDDETGGGARAGGGVLVQIGSKNHKKLKVQQQPPLAGSDDPHWAADLLSEAADGMAGQEFTATHQDLCRVCPVQPVCPLQPTGRQVGS
jgi:superfamily I DNA/RNA helicase/RecB family exonuclease